jgi:signal transduction histidine kinase
MTERDQLRRIGLWFASIRLLAVPIAVAGVAATDFPESYELWAWVSCAVLAVGAVILFERTRRQLSSESRKRLVEVAWVFDTVIVFTFIFIFASVPGQAYFALYYIPVLEAALRFGIVGGLATPIATAPLLVAAEWLRADRFFPHDFRFDFVGARIALALVIGVVAGRLVDALIEQADSLAQRASEAEQLRDALGRRVDLLEAANRCARALGSSLELEQAFQAFIRELRGLMPFDRTAIVLAEDGAARVIATAGEGADDVFPPGSARPISGTVLEHVLEGETVYREDMADERHPEERALLELGLRCRLATPLLAGSRTVGMLSLVRREPSSFSAEEIELVSLLGRLVATAVQNIRAYEAERETVEELRRLSALRADFVSLVSHELRTPMAAVIGSARTLEQRWRELSAEQRDSFLALIAAETSRLADLIADVLDTSRLEAGTFTYTFSDVDLAELIRDVVAAAGVAQDEVQVHATVAEPLPGIRGDRERLRQVLANLVDNAVKYSPAGEEVKVVANAADGQVRVDVSDRGPGIAREQQRLIFEKFGRAKGPGKSLPGTGLGLFIARSIAEAHGGSLDVHSAGPEEGATFTLALPVEP